MRNSVNIDISTASEKQIRFFKSRKRYVAYGGARGGGKSWALDYKTVMLAVRYSGISILLLRRHLPELRQNHVRQLGGILGGCCRYNESKREFRLPNGSVIYLGYFDTDNDSNQYQGNQYDVICIDEATQFTEHMFSVLTACLRGVNNFPKRMYLTCNPGGIGHDWVKRLFVSKRYRADENPDDYEFIPATVFDNTVLLSSDPEYVRMLNNLPDGLREAWRDGNWDMLAGRYFDEFDRNIHVITPFEIPEHWLKYRAIDYGLDCLACVWVAVDELGNHYVYREYAYPDKVISVGVEDILELTPSSEKIQYTVAPSDLWSRSQESAKCKADLFAEHGLVLIKGNNNRETGWLAVKDMLRVFETDSGKESRLKIFSNCVNLAEYLPALQRDAKHPTDCMTEPHEITHLPDALRYFECQFTVPAKVPEKKTELQKYKDKVLNGHRRRGWKHCI